MKTYKLLLVTVVCLSLNSFANTTPQSTTLEMERTTQTMVEQPGQIDSKAVMLDDVLLYNFRAITPRASFPLTRLRAMHLPRSLDKTRNFNATYKDANGKELGVFTAYAQAPNRNPSWLLGNFNNPSGVGKDLELTTEGKYDLEFAVGNEVFDRFSFTVKKVVKGNGSTQYLKTGPWENLAFLRYNTNDRSPFLLFVVYLIDLNEGSANAVKNGKYTVKIVRDKDKKILAWSNKSGSSSLYPQNSWTRQRLNFTGYDPKAILAQDGNYHVEFTFGGKLYGKYPFKVADGKFVGITEYNGDKIGSDGTVFWMPRQQK